MILFSPVSEPLSTLFTFQATSLPSLPLPPFKFKRHVHRRSPKRSRPVADVDELAAESKKKRRLRLMLITSRLSRPFSTPATHIVDPGTSKIAVWAKQRHLTQQVLRKAAIMNRVRRKTLERKDSGVSVGEDERREAREAVLEEMKVDMDEDNEDDVQVGYNPNAIATRVDESRWSVPPSPLGLSNYDALDDEDDWYESYHEEEESDQMPQMPPARAEGVTHEDKQQYYSDWNFVDILSPHSNNDAQQDVEEDDDDEFDEGQDPFHLTALPEEIAKERRPPSPPEDRLIELVREKQRQREITAGFLHFA